MFSWLNSTEDPVKVTVTSLEEGWYVIELSQKDTYQGWIKDALIRMKQAKLDYQTADDLTKPAYEAIHASTVMEYKSALMLFRMECKIELETE